jgi:hypothetical protein
LTERGEVDGDQRFDVLGERLVHEAAENDGGRGPFACEFGDERLLHDERLMTRKLTGPCPFKKEIQMAVWTEKK